MTLTRSPSAFRFVFYSSRPPRDLHSFPTRRSSDLERVAHAMRDRQRLIDAERPGLELVREILAFEPRHKDRKSTRLNSSHVAISYAVFCLKKKKKNVVRIYVTK